MSQEKIPVTLWLTFEQITALCSVSRDLPVPHKEIQQALTNEEEFKKKSQEKDLQLQLSEAFLLQNQHLRNLLNESATALDSFHKNYEKDKKQIEKLKKDVKEGKKESSRGSKSATIGSTSSITKEEHKDKDKEEGDEKKEHKRGHARRKSVDHSRRLSSSKKGSVTSTGSVGKSPSKKDASESNGKGTS